MQNERHITGLFAHGRERLKRKTFPVFGVLAVDVADACGEHRYAEVGDHLALIGIGAFAHAHDAVLFAADGADFRFKRKSLFAADFYELGRFRDVFFDGVVRAVEHDRREARIDALVAAFIGAVVEVERHGNGDLELVDHRLDHVGDGLKTAHILARALAYAEDDGGVKLLRGEQDRFRPFEIVDVELADGIFARLCFCEHFLSRD